MCFVVALVSVPIRGLFNLTRKKPSTISKKCYCIVSVPIRGLFNLTGQNVEPYEITDDIKFPSPLGDYLI